MFMPIIEKSVPDFVLFRFPRWRFKTAATRDHSLSLKTQNQVKLFSSNRGVSFFVRYFMHVVFQSEELIHQDCDENWHTALCTNFVHEYKQYLHSLGFHSIQRFNEDFPSSLYVVVEFSIYLIDLNFVDQYIEFFFFLSEI